MLPLPLQFGPPPIFRLFGLFFAAVGALNLVKPREMTSYAVKRRVGGATDGRIEPTRTRLLFTRLVGGFMILIGLGLATGSLGF